MKMEKKTLRVKEILARLLSKENISVLFSSQTSAKFDLARRILFCPLLEGLDSDIANLIIGHEVGHALYTDKADLEAILKDPNFKIVPKTVRNHNQLSKQIWNVIEDAKIERMQCDTYPGMRAIFAEGYRRLFSTEFDFFKVHEKQTNVNKLSTIDKLNLLAKVGPFSTVVLNPIETGFFNRMMKIEKFVDLVELGREIWAYMVEQNQDMRPEDDENEGEGKGKPSEGEQSEEEKEQQQSEPGEEEAEPQEIGQTQKDFDDSLKDTIRARQETSMKYFEIPKVIDPYKVVVRWKDILTRAEAGCFIDPNLYSRFFKENSKIVSEMAAVFNMRRSAANMAKQKFAKTGVLDMDALSMHNFKDDIFQRVSVMPLQKNHGLSILIDWSGSMKPMIKQTVDQVLLLVMFCRLIKIPYNVYLFTGGARAADPDADNNLKYTMSVLQMEENLKFDEDSTEVYRFKMNTVRLVQIFSSEMPDKSFIDMANVMLGVKGLIDIFKEFSMGATPMLTAMVYNSYLIADMKKRYNLDKMHQVFITDGSPTDGLETYVSKSPDQHLFVIDGETRKPYKFFAGTTSEFFRSWSETVLAEKNVPSSATMAFAQISKERTGVSNYGFYIIPAGLNDRLEIVQASLASGMRSSLQSSDFWIELLRKYQAKYPKDADMAKTMMAELAEKRMLTFSNNVFDNFHIATVIHTGETTQQQHFRQLTDNDAKKSDTHRNNNLKKNFQSMMFSRELKKLYCLDFIKAFA